MFVEIETDLFHVNDKMTKELWPDSVRGIYGHAVITYRSGR